MDVITFRRDLQSRILVYRFRPPFRTSQTSDCGRSSCSSRPLDFLTTRSLTLTHRNLQTGHCKLAAPPRGPQPALHGFEDSGPWRDAGLCSSVVDPPHR